MSYFFKVISSFSFLVLMSSASQAATPILTYSYAMQAHGSDLVVYDDGTIEHKERLGYKTAPVAEKQLETNELVQLKTLIEEAAQFPLTIGRPVLDRNAAGNLYGSLVVKSALQEGVILRHYEMEFLNNQPYRKVQSRASEATSKIIQFVSKYTQDDMPL